MSAIKYETEKIFVNVGGLMNAKYSLINVKLYQTIGVINLNKIKNCNKIKKFLVMGRRKLPGAE